MDGVNLVFWFLNPDAGFGFPFGIIILIIFFCFWFCLNFLTEMYFVLVVLPYLEE